MNNNTSIKNESNELLQLVSFMIGNEEYAVDILLVQEINRMMQITRVPNTPEYVDGVINLRGRVIPVIDLRYKLGLAKKDDDKNTRIIVVEIKNKTIGFKVDAVKEVVRIQENITEAPPELVSGTNSEFIKSVGKLDDKLLILIDLEKVLFDGQFAELTEAA
ncbi:MAG: chemotaxis protein CheW [Ignavibacteriales bacterium]|nr:MAG: chemotaxis protein CheW [Ignavibacteriales bacterium]